MESNRHRSAVESTLRRHDVTLLAERRRRHLIPNLPWGDGCRCCYDPNSDGGEYRALIELRENIEKEKEEQGEEDDDDPEEKDSREADEDSDDDEFDYLLDEDLPGEEGGFLAEMEDRRRAELELDMLHREAALQHGYGAHRQIHPVRILRAAGLGASPRSHNPPPPGVVLHLFDADSAVSASLDIYLEELAEKTRGTKFLRASGRSVLLMDADFAKQVLPSLSPDSDLPALVAIRDGNVVAVCPRLQGLSDEEQIDKSSVNDWLDHAGVLIEQHLPMDEVCGIRPEEMALYDFMPDNEKKPPEEPRYDCGNPMCHKSFPHDHVGMKNELQGGLVVQEEEVVGPMMP